MRYYFPLILCLVTALFPASAQTVVFNWSDPASLTPSFEAPTSANRYGPYIGETIFTTTEGISLDIDDSDVKELSQKARFLYGYLTEEVELRVYPNSTITISVPEGKTIVSVSFTGAKADDSYLTYTGDKGILKGNTWTSSGGIVPSVGFAITTTINCTSTTVVIGDAAGINDVTIDEDNVIWFGTDGTRYSGRPKVPGVYIRQNNAKSSKILIR
ncbi:MAG: hypothetical protein K2K84_10220 [Muribaculaceae bacterium]|nr:hypothetical protein [Muribaculaceae bacterium]